MTTPNFRRLTLAYNVLKDIPRNKVRLNTVVDYDHTAKNGASTNPECGTLACGIGWLSLNKSFRRMGLRFDPIVDELTLVKDGEAQEIDYGSAAEEIFNIDVETAEYLFTTKDSYGVSRPMVDYKGSRRREMVSDKSELLARFETVFKHYGKELPQ